jgi:hypothetical protein
MKTKILLVLILGIFLTFGTVAMAQGDGGISIPNDESGTSNPNDCNNTTVVNGVTVVSLCNPLGNNNITVPQIAGKIIQVVISLLGIISLLMFIYAGFTWLTAGGKSEAIKKGKETMIWAVAGLVVVFSSYIVLHYLFNDILGKF